MFKGLSAFPLTPLINGEIDKKSFTSLLENLVNADVDSIGALGSTGSYAYLTREQRYKATTLAVSIASNIPVMTSIGHVSTEEVLRLADDAQKAGVSGVLLAPVSYQKLNPDEVFSLYERVNAELSVPLCIYENVATTGFEFTEDLFIALSYLDKVGSIKLGYIPSHLSGALESIENLRRHISNDVTIGISGDAQSAIGLLAGCDVWYSVLGGLFPNYTLGLTHAALNKNEPATLELDMALEPLWVFFRRYGSLRVISTIAELKGGVSSPCLPFPLQTLAGTERKTLGNVLDTLNFLE